VSGGCDLIYDGSIGGLRSRMCRVAAISYTTGASGGCDLACVGWLRSHIRREHRVAAISHVSGGCDLIYLIAIILPFSAHHAASGHGVVTALNGDIAILFIGIKYAMRLICPLSRLFPVT